MIAAIRRAIREKPGVISRGPCWVTFGNSRMFTARTYLGLVLAVAWGWNDDRNLV